MTGQAAQAEERRRRLAAEKRRWHALAFANASWAADEIRKRRSGENPQCPRA